MNASPIGFSLAEKLAIVYAVDSVILADDIVHQGEIKALRRLMERIDFDSNFVLQARNIAPDQAQKVLRDMPDHKKKMLVQILEEIAISDGFVHEKESILMSEIFNAINISAKIKRAK